MMMGMSRDFQRRLRRGFMNTSADSMVNTTSLDIGPHCLGKVSTQVLSSSVAESDLHPQASCRLASAESRSGSQELLSQIVAGGVDGANWTPRPLLVEIPRNRPTAGLARILVSVYG